MELNLLPHRQTPGYCGPASLKIVLRFFGKNISEAKLAKLSGATKEKGASAAGLIKAARKLGFRVYSKQNSSLNEVVKFLKLNLPVIIHWFPEDDGHYSVICGIEKNKIFIADPQFGKIRAVSKQEFLKHWFDYKTKSGKPRGLKWLMVVKQKI